MNNPFKWALKTIASKSSLSAEDWVDKGDRHIREGRPNEAVLCYDKALDATPRNVPAWTRRGRALGVMGLYPEAVKSFEAAIEIDPLDREAWRHKGFNLYRMNRFEEALVCFNRVAHIDVEDHHAWYWIGLALEALGRPEAGAALERAGRLCKKVKESRVVLMQ